MKRADQTYDPCLTWLKARSITLTLMIVASLLFSVALSELRAADTPAGASTLAAVNQVPIESHSLEAALQAYLSRIGHRELPAERLNALRREILKYLIEEELLYQEALKRDLSLTEVEINAGVFKIRDRFQSTQSFEAALKQQGLDPKAIRQGVKRSLLINKIGHHLSKMPRAERENALKQISGTADIQIHVRPVNRTVSIK